MFAFNEADDPGDEDQGYENGEQARNEEIGNNSHRWLAVQDAKGTFSRPRENHPTSGGDVALKDFPNSMLNPGNSDQGAER